jgi:hypothetical protein
MAGAGGYDVATTELHERALVTILGNAGFWGQHLYLVGGLVPRYLTIGSQSMPHVGSRDVDLAIVLAVDATQAGEYETLKRNLMDLGFRQAPLPEDPEFRWRRDVNGEDAVLEFLCDLEGEAAGRNVRLRSGAGSGFQALNVLGVRLIPEDHRVIEVEAERLDGGRSRIPVRIAGLASFTTLKVRAFVDRHQDKDAYDLVYTYLNAPGGPSGAGQAIAASAVAADGLVVDALATLRDRFSNPGNDAPVAYARFLAPPDDAEAVARLRNEAVEVVRRVLVALDRSTEAP